MKKSVRSTDPCEPAGTMHVRCERYVARALEIFGERQSACGAKIHWRVSSRGEAGAPHVRATKGSDRAGRGEEEWHAQRVGLLLRRWREVSYLLWYNPRVVLNGTPRTHGRSGTFMVQAIPRPSRRAWCSVNGQKKRASRPERHMKSSSLRYV